MILDQDIYIDQRVISYAIKSCNQASNNDLLKPLIEPHMQTILEQKIIKILILSKKEMEDFTENPIEFIRTQHDITMTFYNAKSSALDLINSFTKYK